MDHHKLALLTLLASVSCVSGRLANEPNCQDIPARGQCGGIGGSCGHKPEYKCGDGPYPRCKCIDGYECTSKDERFWQCTPHHKPCIIPIHGQCGGKGGNCRDWKQCYDQPFESCTCASGSTCQKQDEYYYECRPPVTLNPPQTHTPGTTVGPKCAIPKWGICTPRRHPEFKPPEPLKHVKNSSSGDGDCGKPGHKCGVDAIISDTYHCKCTQGTECRKLDHEHVWKCLPTQEISPSLPPAPRSNDCPTACQVKVLYGHQVTGICSGSRGGYASGKSKPCPAGYVSSGEQCANHQGCGECCVKNPVSSPGPPSIPSPPPIPKVCPTTCGVTILYGQVLNGICSGTGASYTGGKSTPCPPGYISSGEKCGYHNSCGECCVNIDIASPSANPSSPPPPKLCPNTCEVKVLYGQVLNGICSGIAASYTGGNSASCPPGYISSGEKCGSQVSCGECCLKTDPSPNPLPPNSPSPTPDVCPTICYSMKFEGYGSGVCSSSLASSYRTYCPPGYINSGENCDYGNKECGVCCIKKSSARPPPDLASLG